MDKIRYADHCMQELNIPRQHVTRKGYRYRGELAEQIYYLIHTIPDLNKLCSNCSMELIILFLSFYVKSANTRYRPPEEYNICKTQGLTTDKYASLLIKLNKHFMTKQTLAQRVHINSVEE
jgi:hypothetical protein